MGVLLCGGRVQHTSAPSWLRFLALCCTAGAQLSHHPSGQCWEHLTNVGTPVPPVPRPVRDGIFQDTGNGLERPFLFEVAASSPARGECLEVIAQFVANEE